MCNIFQIQLRLGFLIATFGLVVSCLITNCPRGGKRSEVADEVQTNTYADISSPYCTPCGPGNEGVCVDRGLCCGRGIGCHTSPRHTKQCRNVSTFQSSCFSELFVPACGDKGRCKSRYLCCLKDQCVLDMSCKSMPSVKYKDPADHSTHLFPSLPPKNLIYPAGLAEDENWKPKYDWSLLTLDYES